MLSDYYVIVFSNKEIGQHRVPQPAVGSVHRQVLRCSPASRGDEVQPPNMRQQTCHACRTTPRHRTQPAQHPAASASNTV
jgi:hypothetical protein